MKNFTQIPNSALEKLWKLKLNGTQLRLILLLWRYTYGFHRPFCKFSAGFAAKALGTSEDVCARQLKRLINMGIFDVAGRDKACGARILGFSHGFLTDGDSVSALSAPRDAGNTADSDTALLQGSPPADLPDNNINININLLNSVKENTRFSPSVFCILMSWMTYKAERDEFYTESSMRAFLQVTQKYCDSYGSEAVCDIVAESMASNYKSVIWDRIRTEPDEKSLYAFTESKFDKQELELLSRGSN